MRSHTAHADPIALTPAATPFTRLWRFVLDHFLLLPVGVLIALIWANLDGDGYFRFAHAAAFPINEIAMAFFLALMAQEVYESLMPNGQLHHWHHWAASTIAAIGGAAGSAALFLLYISLAHERVLEIAWPVVAAVDVAAGYYIMRLIYPRGAAAAAFVLLAAMATDAVVMAVVTLRSPDFTLNAGGLLTAFAALIGAVALRRTRVMSVWPYLFACGAALWLAFYQLGLHPAMALVPLVPLLPHHARRRGEVLADQTEPRPLHRDEHRWFLGAQVALFLFGLANGGVVVTQADTGTWAVLVSSVIGRPAGIIVAVGLAMAAGLRLPGRMRWPDLVVAALAMTAGFTLALFVSSIALPIGAVRQQVTVGALATALGALTTLAAARFLMVGRFAPPRRSEEAVPARTH